jgi:hypothetical protein
MNEQNTKLSEAELEAWLDSLPGLPDAIRDASFDVMTLNPAQLQILANAGRTIVVAMKYQDEVCIIGMPDASTGHDIDDPSAAGNPVHAQLHAAGSVFARYPTPWPFRHLIRAPHHAFRDGKLIAPE